MKTKNIFKTLALAMMMPAMLLTTACSNQDDVANTSNITNKGYALPVTVNVTRGDGATRATFDGSKLNFGEGDKLFVEGPNNGGAGQFAGTLTWQSGGTFSGTIYTQNPYSGTADALLTSAGSGAGATLLPNGYQSTGFLSINNNSTPDVAYDDEASSYFNGAFVASETAKATGVEQLSFEQASTYSSGFALTPRCAILNFTISGLEAGEKTVTLNVVKGTDYIVTGSVTPNASGVATFAIGVPVGANIKDMANNLTVGTHNFTLPSSTTFAAGKIYNINRAAPVVTNLSSISVAHTAINGETLTGTLGADVQISIADGATVTLNNVNINGTNNSSYKWAGITCEGDATIILSGTNTVKGFYEDYPGIQAAVGKTLTIQGTGSLTASPFDGGSSFSYGAGIGGGNEIACGNIEIQGGTITATGGNQAAGIGSGDQVTCGNITISGGTVTATGGPNGAAGIGSGSRAGCGTITITTGVTQVTATKGSGADNSIGAGFNGSCGTVRIGDTEYWDGSDYINDGDTYLTTSPLTYTP